MHTRWVRQLGRSHPGNDFALWAAGLTFFGLVGLVPAVLVSLRVAAALAGPDVVTAQPANDAGKAANDAKKAADDAAKAADKAAKDAAKAADDAAKAADKAAKDAAKAADDIAKQAKDDALADLIKKLTKLGKQMSGKDD